MRDERAMQDFEKLRVWVEAHQLALEIYRVTRSFPREERFGLTAQLRDAARSVPANIAEGSAASRPTDFAHSVNISEKEAAEVLNHLIIARDLTYLAVDVVEALRDRVNRLRRSLMIFRHCILHPTSARR
ncbi:MAG: four helix bundle protein [Deltaproteobacteria bacterium]|nr:four helix bundle protein [Deltaproteobacteria bacterium]